MTDKTKRGIIVTGGLIVSVALIFGIAKQLQKAPIDDVGIAEKTTENTTITVPEQLPTETEISLHIEPISTTTSTENSSGDDDGFEQEIQPDPEPKPTAPSEEFLETATTPPDINPPEMTENEPTETETTETEITEKEENSVTSPPKNSEPKHGDTRVNNGKNEMYFLGFGWIEDEGGGAEGHKAEDMYQNGNKVGIM